jgi:hypothetical protein
MEKYYANAGDMVEYFKRIGEDLPDDIAALVTEQRYAFLERLKRETRKAKISGKNLIYVDTYFIQKKTKGLYKIWLLLREDISGERRPVIITIKGIMNNGTYKITGDDVDIENPR